MACLTHSAWEYFEKLAFKKTKTRNFKRFYLKSWREFRDAINGRGLRPYNPWCRCQARRAQRVNLYKCLKNKMKNTIKQS